MFRWALIAIAAMLPLAANVAAVVGLSKDKIVQAGQFYGRLLDEVK